MTLQITYAGKPQSEFKTDRMRKLVEQMMAEQGQSGRSASGWTAAMAIDWCIAHKKGWRLTAAPEGGYLVEVFELS